MHPAFSQNGPKKKRTRFGRTWPVSFQSISDFTIILKTWPENGRPVPSTFSPGISNLAPGRPGKTLLCLSRIRFYKTSRTIPDPILENSCPQSTFNCPRDPFHTSTFSTFMAKAKSTLNNHHHSYTVLATAIHYVLFDSTGECSCTLYLLHVICYSLSTTIHFRSKISKFSLPSDVDENFVPKRLHLLPLGVSWGSKRILISPRYKIPARELTRGPSPHRII